MPMAYLMMGLDLASEHVPNVFSHMMRFRLHSLGGISSAPIMACYSFGQMSSLLHQDRWSGFDSSTIDYNVKQCITYTLHVFTISTHCVSRRRCEG